MTLQRPDRLLTPAQVAQCFAVDPKTVTRWAKNGLLPFVQTLGGHRRYKKSVIDALLEEKLGAKPAVDKVEPE